MSRAVLLCCLLGCGSPKVPAGDSDLADTDSDSDVDTDADSDTDADPGTDADGDGFTVEAGDCDDDNIWVNPGWPEDTNDDLDNDCDGRIDEVFSGLLVADIDLSGVGASSLRTINTLGDLSAQQVLSSGQPMSLRAQGGGWVAFDGASPQVLDLSANGQVSTRVSFEGFDWAGELGEPDPYWLWGAAPAPDGTVWVGAFDRLLQVEVDGSWLVRARWKADLEGGPFKLGLIDLVVNPLSGVVTLVGVTGAHARFDPASDSLSFQKTGDLGDQQYSVSAVSYCDGGALVMLGEDTDGRGVFRWSEADADWALVRAWDNSFAPDQLACEGETGDIYLSAHGGWAQSVWRLLADGSYLTQLYTTGNTCADCRFSALSVLWDEDGTRR